MALPSHALASGAAGAALGGARVSAFDEAQVDRWSLYFPTSDCLVNDPRVPIVRVRGDCAPPPLVVACRAWWWWWWWGWGEAPSAPRSPASHLRLCARVASQALADFFVERRDAYLEAEQARRFQRVCLDFAQLREDIPVEKFEEMLKEEPALVLACLSLSCHNALDRVLDAGPAAAVPLTSRISVRMTNYKPHTPLRNIKSNFVDKFVAVRGNVVRVSSIRPLVTAMDFSCPKCGHVQRMAFTDGKYSPPLMCVGRCKGRFFMPVRGSAATIDYQRIRLQEIVSGDQSDQGRIPRTIDCELTADLVDCAIPGDVVTIAGIVKARKTQVRGARGQNRSLFLLYIDVNSVETGSEQENGKLDILQLGARDMQAIAEVAEQKELFKLLVHSLAPSIFGHELVKAGLLLALFGGVPKNSGERGKVAVRGDPHVLVVGDPGLGKSQMLRAVSAAAPRGIYVCGNNTSTSGLTVTMVREGSAADFSLEAGALVLADQGVCCIDEFDKMSADHNALLEAMEQQSISIAKAGIVCSLSARATVIAAANPVGGHYDRAKTVAENLKIGTALLSRFDIVFILLDKPDEARDQLLSEHVLAIHSGAPRSRPSVASGAGSPPSLPSHMSFGSSQPPAPPASSQLLIAPPFASQGWRVSAADAEWARQRPLAARLRLALDEQRRLDPVPAPLLARYIAYARKYVHPRLSDGAKRVLKAFYLKLRREHQGADCMPITTRQLESLIRLAEARAKAEMREVVTAADACDVVEIMKESMFDVLADEHGQVDFSRSTGVSKSKQAQVFCKALHRAAEQRENALFTVAELRKVALDLHLGVEDLDGFIDKLNDQGMLLKKGPRLFQVQSSTFSQ
jgi:DNA helicase MCM8